MDQRDVPSTSAQIGALQRMTACARACKCQDPMEVQEALERGFGLLMSLEAQLQRRQRIDPPTDVLAAAGPEDLLGSITALRDALTELRQLSSHSDEPRAGYGFVLPGARRRKSNARDRSTRE
jgi:hypothetical protein